MRIYASDSHIPYLNEPNFQSIAQNPQWKALLHYRGNSSLIPKKSHFFLSKKGYKNPLDELEATLTLLDSIKGQEQFFCHYPARAKFLAIFFPHIESLKSQILCEAYDEFRIIVPRDKISLVFAAESDIYPGSAMGHIYLALQGRAKQDFHKVFSEREVLDVHKGQEIGYSVSFFANTELGLNPIAYIKAFIGNLPGAYALMPLENSVFEYIENEKRNLYWLQLKLDSMQKDMLLAHLWELKDVLLHYSFATHNCNDALKSVLSVADSAFDARTLKPYQTPTEYISSLNRAGLITHTKVQVPPNKRTFTKKYGENDILHTRSSAKLSFGYENLASNSLLSLYIAPVYSHINDVNNAYVELIESRLLGIDMRFDMRDNRAFIRQIEALHLFSIADTFSTKSLAKYIDLSFLTPLYSHSTALKPKITFGAGLGSYVGNMSTYIIPLLGYEYIQTHNVFIDMRVGAIAQFNKARLIGSYDYYIDSANKRGYNQHIEAFIGINLYKQLDLYMKMEYYVAESIFLHKDIKSLSAGLSVNF